MRLGVSTVLFAVHWLLAFAISSASKTPQTRGNWTVVDELGISFRQLSANASLPQGWCRGESCTVTNLRGLAMSRPCCGLLASGVIECHFRGTRSEWISGRVIIDGDEDPKVDWQKGHGFVAGDIECVSRKKDALDLMVVGNDNELSVRVYDVNSDMVPGWKTIEIFLTDTPTCVSRDSLSIDCVLRDYLNNVYYLKYSESTWGELKPLGQVLTHPIGCGVYSTGRFDCFAAEKQNRLYQVYYSNGAWLTYRPKSSLLKGRPSVVWSSSERLDIFALGMNSDVVQTTWDHTNGGWQGSASLGGVFDTDPECFAVNKDQFHCFAVGPDSQLYRNRWDSFSQWWGTHWRGWTKISEPPSSYLETPSCVIDSESRIHCFIRNSQREIEYFRC